jgi:hypothetical protein
MSSGVEYPPERNDVSIEAEKYPSLFVTRKYCRGIAIVESCYQVTTSESRLRRLGVQ